MKFLLCLLPLLTLTDGYTSICDESASYNDQFSVLFHDAFDGETLSDQWVITEGNELGQLRDTWGTKENINVVDGKLTITTKREHSNGYNFTSGALTTKDRQSFSPPFKACVSAQLPGSNIAGEMDGIWPAHWMMPNNISCWPDAGEIDIMEQIDGVKTIYSTYHWNPEKEDENPTPCDNGHDHAGVNAWVETSLTEFHEYAVYADENGVLTYYIDGDEIGKIDGESKGEMQGTTPEAPTDAFYIILNTAVSEGGVWPKAVSDKTVFPIVHHVDDVKVLGSK